jgi:hypothetical protein
MSKLLRAPSTARMGPRIWVDGETSPRIPQVLQELQVNVFRSCAETLDKSMNQAPCATVLRHSGVARQGRASGVVPRLHGRSLPAVSATPWQTQPMLGL